MITLLKNEELGFQLIIVFNEPIKMQEPNLTPKASTKICLEKSSETNPYQTEKLYMAGYDIEEVAKCASYSDVLFLLFKGELPTSGADKELLETLMILLSLPSPRHTASRAAMNAGICKSNAEHLLPISLMALGGSQLGAVEVQNCYQFINKCISTDQKNLLEELKGSWDDKRHHIAPGFGQLYGEIDSLSSSFLAKLLEIKPEGKVVKWVYNFSAQLSEIEAGILDVGIAACVFCELGFGARESVGLYQLMRAPGLLAYAMEQTHKPVSAIPMLEDEQYELI